MRSLFDQGKAESLTATARSQTGAVTDWTPGAASMPMNGTASWVRLHELAGPQLGALTMTATDTPRAYTLRSLRYCAP
ncbi:hypothetical protein EJ065_1994 [Corallococcus coralloides]|uniref:Uncharacterized protein n=1 Tax=Corallococcus coralloides TaxID=184914 RepID=A0A410RNS1_CORCK|nr:hypothetical protein [Corallococcus coralloides]QAT83580.1 hypothetical protein EJ065_1994 [Corallococcus coralloides]